MFVTPELLAAPIEYYNPNNVAIADVAHAVVLGGGRDADGVTPKIASRHRGEWGAIGYLAHNLDYKAGKLALLGYKSPVDRAGEPWTPEDPADPYYGEIFQGIPESYGLHGVVRRINPDLADLYGRGIPSWAVRNDPRSTTTTTNFTELEAQRLLWDDPRDLRHPDERPAFVASQANHVERAVDDIARKTARRDVVGLVVPDVRGTDSDTAIARWLTKPMMVGLHQSWQSPEVTNAIAKFNARAVWSAVLAVEGIAPEFFASKTSGYVVPTEQE